MDITPRGLPDTLKPGSPPLRSFATANSAYALLIAGMWSIILIVQIRSSGHSWLTTTLIGLLLGGLAAILIVASFWRYSRRLRDCLQSQTEDEPNERDTMFRAITEQLRGVVFVTDQLGVITYISPSVQDIFGLTPAEVTGQHFSRLLPGEDPAHVQAVLAATQDAGGQQAQPIELQVLRAHGPTFSGQLNCTRFEYAGKIGMLGVIHDISARKRAELALEAECALLAQRVDERTSDLNRATLSLAQAVRATDSFLANMSHELRTPLSTVLGLSESLLDEIYGPLSPSQSQVLATIQQSGQHLLAIVNDMLDMAKISAGHLDLQLERILVVDVCQASLRLVSGAAQQKRIQVGFTFSDPQLTVEADPQRLKQILVNLLSNAIKFTPEDGQVNLSITAEPELALIRLTVEDNGIGIPAGMIGQLFRPFTQLDTSFSRRYAGSGIGLALVHLLVDMHGGSIEVQSEGLPGQGSCFTISLPWPASALIRDGSQALVAEPGATELTGQIAEIHYGTTPGHPTGDRSAEAPEGSQATILLVEDNLPSNVVISEYLSFQGYAVISAYNGQEGVERAREYRPDLILMDIQLPVLDGLQATRQIRADPNITHTPIIALTALAMPGDRERCLEAGTNAYLTKPVSLRVLLATIQKYLVPTKAAED